ncbi:YadA family autotransporter adhesin, partial [Nitratifractor sp.]
AVNVSQLNNTTANLKYFDVNDTGTNQTPAYTGADGAVAIGPDANASGEYSLALGTGSRTLAAGASAFGAGAEALDLNGTALGAGAVVQAGATNAVALGAGSVATEADTVSVGASGHERRITNVAAGVNATDAVNVSQLNQQVQGAYNSAFTLSGTHDTNLSITDGNGTLSVDLSTLETNLGLQNEANISALAGGVSNNEANITSLDSRVSTNEQNISNNAQHIADNSQRITDVNSTVQANSVAISDVNATAQANKAELRYFDVNASNNQAPANATATGALAAGEGAVAGEANATAIGRNAQATAGNSVAIGAGSIADQNNTVSVGSTGNERRITHVAAGVDPTDAVNVSQLNQQLQGGYNSAFTLGGAHDTNLSITDGNGTLSVDLSTVQTDLGLANRDAITEVNQTAQANKAELRYFEVNATGNPGAATATAAGAFAAGGDARAGDLNATALGTRATASAPSATAVGYGAAAGGANSAAFGSGAQTSAPAAVAVGYGALSSGENAVAIGSSALSTESGALSIGANAQALAPQAAAVGYGAVVEAGAERSVAFGPGARVAANVRNSVALGSGSVATEDNTISVGSPGNERRITNVAAGINPTDAVNVSQLQAISGVVADNRRYIEEVDRHARAGIAMTSAMSAIVPNYRAHGDTQISIGMGNYRGETAIAAGAFHYFNDNVLINIGASYSPNGGGAAIRAGITWGF